MGRTVSSPSMPGATNSSTPSSERTRRSAVTISTVRGIGCGSAVGTRNREQGTGRDKVRRLGDGVRRDGSRTEFAGEISCCDRPFVPQGDNVGSCGVFLHLVGLLLGFFDGTDHVERLLGEVVPLAFKDFFEATDGVLDADVAALAAGEDFGDEHGLREEALDAARSRNSLLVLLRELFGAEDGDDVLEVSVALEDSLYAAGRVVVLLTDDARVEDSREGGERVDGGVERLLNEGAGKRNDGVEMAEGSDHAGVGVVVGGDVDRLEAGG